MSEKNQKDWKKFKEQVELEEREENLDSVDGEDEIKEAASTQDKGFLNHPSYIELEEKLTLAEQEAFENREKLMRTLAELENVRRRAERDVSDASRYGAQKLLVALLPVVDSLEQALQLADKETQSGMREGLELTMKLLLDVLAKHDVVQLDPQNEVFNPEEHEAMSIQDVPGAAPNSIVTVFQKGYKLNDRIIRPARVIVAKPKSSNE